LDFRFWIENVGDCLRVDFDNPKSKI